MLQFGKMLKKFRFLILIVLLASVLRLYDIHKNPPSLFGDELDLGYHAYSILKTGRDYQGNFLPLHFHSLAEWRTPLYLYSAVPTVGLFGISPLGVRLPAALYGIFTVPIIYFLSLEIFKSKKISYLSALILALSPWHLQYSRAGFEVTQLLFFLMGGLLLFLKSLKNSKYLWISVALLTATPWIYSTAKLFTPILFLLLFVLFRKEILSLKRQDLIRGALAGLIIGLPVAWSTLFGGGSERFSYISVFSDPTIEAEVGYDRTNDSRVRGETGLALTPTFLDRVIHNKFTFVGENILKNYLQSFGTDFLFIKGDPDPRHSIGIGEFYRIELFALFFGIIFIFSGKINKKIKIFILFWLILAPLPSAITRDGGNHATRLIMLLPPMVLVLASGLAGVYDHLRGKEKIIIPGIYIGLWFLSLGFYLHEYHKHYPWFSERWWHAGWGQAVGEIKKIDNDFDRVIISMSGEPAWIFFAGYYEYSPDKWQAEYPIGRDEDVAGFGKISHTGKYYFGTPSEDIQIYGLGKYINERTLYLANAKEVGENLILNPQKSPAGLNLIKTIPFPSGEPAFYLFQGLNKE